MPNICAEYENQLPKMILLCYVVFAIEYLGKE